MGHHFFQVFVTRPPRGGGEVWVLVLPQLDSILLRNPITLTFLFSNYSQSHAKRKSENVSKLTFSLWQKFKGRLITQDNCEMSCYGIFTLEKNQNVTKINAKPTGLPWYVINHVPLFHIYIEFQTVTFRPKQSHLKEAILYFWILLTTSNFAYCVSLKWYASWARRMSILI